MLAKSEMIEDIDEDVTLTSKDKCWKKIPGFGFILISIALIVQNILFKTE